MIVVADVSKLKSTKMPDCALVEAVCDGHSRLHIVHMRVNKPRHNDVPLLVSRDGHTRVLGGNVRVVAEREDLAGVRHHQQAVWNEAYSLFLVHIKWVIEIIQKSTAHGAVGCVGQGHISA